MAVAGLAGAIGAVFPFLGAIAVLLATFIIAYGVAVDVQELLGHTASPNLLTRMRAYLELGRLFRFFLAQPTLQQEIVRAGQEPARLDLDTQAAVQGAMRADLTMGELPTFSTPQQAQEYLQYATQIAMQAGLPLEELRRVRNHVAQEVLRLELGITPEGLAASPTLLQELSTLPTFRSRDELNAFIEQIRSWWTEGYLTGEGYARLARHLEAESARILAAEAEEAARLAAEEAARLAAEALRRAALAAAVPAVEVPPGVPTTITHTPDLTLAVSQLQGYMAALAQSGQVSSEQLAAMNANLAAIAGTLAAPAPRPVEAPGLEGALGGIGAALTGTGVGTLAGSIATALAAQAGSSGHAVQQARYGSMTGFLAPLLSLARTILPQAIAGTLLIMDSPIRRQLEELVEGLIRTQLAPEQFARPASYEEAVANASRRLLQAIGFGLQAQGIAYTAEAITPLKQIGFAQLAGFMGEVAGFGRIAAGLMGTVETAAIYRPLQYEANRRFRPALPDPGLLEAMYAKYALTREETADYLERQGLDELVISRLPAFLYRDPRFGELIRAFQLQPPTFAPAPDPENAALLARAGVEIDADWFIKVKLAKSGLERIDVEAFTPVVKMGILRREQTLRYDQVTRLYREGFISRERARQEIELALTFPEGMDIRSGVIEYRLQALDLQREYEGMVDALQLVTSAISKGIITPEEAATQLIDLGLDPQRVTLTVLRSRIGLTPRQVAQAAPTTVPIPAFVGEEE